MPLVGMARHHARPAASRAHSVPLRLLLAVASTARDQRQRCETLPRSHGAALLPAQVPSTFPEDLDKSQYTPESYVVENAKQKALEVHSRLTGTGEEPPQPRPYRPT